MRIDSRTVAVRRLHRGPCGFPVPCGAVRVAGLLTVLLGASLGGDLRGAEGEPLGVQVIDGFEVSLYADDELAHDVFAMTIDPFGRVVVSGAGYIRILVDSNGDGRADQARQFADGPASGAQGMYFHGRDLICTGDGGLIRYRDRDGDDRADGPPDMLLKAKTGGEHDTHAVRKGPDGWFYVIAGNMAQIDKRYANRPTSPVKAPEHGTLFRLAPDLSGGEVIADGMRNAYDFDFNEAGDLFTFDSDGERVISLPWYRPTRVFQLTPGSNAGWRSNDWVQPDDAMDLAPIVASFGRGSPTGVICYRHTQFPEAYRGALFVLDWTYGRVFALPLKRAGGGWSAEPVSFMSAIGQHGFAPTDAEVGPDGSLYVCVGGRGTRGTVYRIRAQDAVAVADPFADGRELSPADRLNACLRAPHPCSSWSRRRWEPVAAGLGREPFAVAAGDESRPEAERVRAIEILTEKFQGLGEPLAQSLAGSSAVAVRARTAWSLGRTNPERPDAAVLGRLVGDGDPLVVRQSLEALLGASPEIINSLVTPIGQTLGHSDAAVRQAAVRVLARTETETYHQMSAVGINTGWQAAISVAQAYALRKPGFSAYTCDIAVRVLKGKHPVTLKRDAARLLEIGLGDVGVAHENQPGVFTAYASRIDLAPHDRELDAIRIALAEIYPTGTAELDHELGRAIAMVQPAHEGLLDKVLAPITADSDPVGDIHQLIIAARMPVERTAAQRTAIAHAVANLEPKILARKLRQDTSWDDRVGETYSALVARDAALPAALLADPLFGRPGHVLFVGEMDPETVSVDDVIGRFVASIKADADYPWSTDVVFLLGASQDETIRDMIRAKFNEFALRNAVVMALSENPLPRDRELFVAGLENTPVEAMTDCVRALGLLDPRDDPHENVLLVRTLRRLAPSGQERELRDQIAEILRLNTRQEFGYVSGRDGDPQQVAIEKWTAWARQAAPDEFAKQEGASGGSADVLKELLATVDWSRGDAARGALVFQRRACAQCHSSRSALGPDLAGAANRFSRDDLFTAIALPNRDVSPRYQTTLLATDDGKVHKGMIVYESVDGLVLRNSLNQTVRIETTEIESRRTLSESLMPEGLLKGATPAEAADLYAYLRSLGLQTATAPPDKSAGK